MRSGRRSNRLPGRKHGVHCAGFGKSEQVLAKRLVRKHLREFGKDIQVLLGRLLGHEQKEQEPHRAAVGCIEWNRFNQPEHHTLIWQGDDGSELLAHYPPADTYNSEVTVAELLKVSAEVDKILA